MEGKLVQFLQKSLNYDISHLLEVPKIKERGDFSLPCFTLTKKFKESPNEIASNLQRELSSQLPEFIREVKAEGSFLNFYIDNNYIIRKLLQKIEDKTFFNIKTPDPKTFVIEYPSPNTNKQLHVGHVRNIVLGTALSNVLKEVGHKVIRVNLNNDRGIAICKVMYSYSRWGDNKTPQSEKTKPDEFISNFYVKFEGENKDEKLSPEAQEILVKWEKGDKETIGLWKKIQSWVFKGYKETYKNYNLEKPDKEFYESEIYNKGREIVKEALAQKIKGFKKDKKGGIFIDLTELDLGKKYLLRGDGTSLYMTQDIYLAYLKEELFKADTYIFVVARDQEYHFKVLFEILKRLKCPAKNYHFSYGYVYNQFGRKFSSRLGNTISADEILQRAINKAKKNLNEKNLTQNLSEEEKLSRATLIGRGAIYFAFLKVNPKLPISFSIENSLSFEGETAPYIQYTYARICSVLKKANFNTTSFKCDTSQFSEKEISLFKTISTYPKVLKKTSENFKISNFTNLSLKIAQNFNDIYQTTPILKAETKTRRISLLVLCHITKQVLKKTLKLLAIETLEEM